MSLRLSVRRLVGMWIAANRPPALELGARALRYRRLFETRATDTVVPVARSWTSACRKRADRPGLLDRLTTLVLVLFLAELAIGLVGRAAPSLNVLSTSFPLKILLSLSLAGLTLTVLPGALERLVQNILRASAMASRMLA